MPPAPAAAVVTDGAADTAHDGPEPGFRPSPIWEDLVAELGDPAVPEATESADQQARRRITARLAELRRSDTAVAEDQTVAEDQAGRDQ